CLLFTASAQATTPNDILAMNAADRLLFMTAWRDGFIHGTAVGVQYYTEDEQQDDLLNVMTCAHNRISGNILLAEFLAAVEDMEQLVAREADIEWVDDVSVALMIIVMDLCPINGVSDIE
ncbi:MAG: hypothetical protein O7E57_12525, partial [Gammaproteobacteria bacterium]|nr:hypothetical protein [Gammaproteobacteria bacterium]